MSLDHIPPEVYKVNNYLCTLEQKNTEDLCHSSTNGPSGEHGSHTQTCVGLQCSHTCSLYSPVDPLCFIISSCETSTFKMSHHREVGNIMWNNVTLYDFIFFLNLEIITFQRETRVYAVKVYE